MKILITQLDVVNDNGFKISSEAMQNCLDEHDNKVVYGYKDMKKHPLSEATHMVSDLHIEGKKLYGTFKPLLKHEFDFERDVCRLKITADCMPNNAPVNIKIESINRCPKDKDAVIFEDEDE